MVKVNVNDLRFAGLRFYDEEHNGVELSDNLSYAILVKKGDSYINPFDLSEDYPVLGRLPYTNSRYDGMEYGTKVIGVYGETVTGPCYVLMDLDFKNIFKCDSISIEKLSQYILKSSKYFKDRENIISDMNPKQVRKIKKSGIIDIDKVKKEVMESFFGERGVTLYKHI